MTGFWEEFQRVNERRCERWHPGGLNEWSRQDWMNAVAGELWEFLAAEMMEKPFEAADTVTYLMILGSSEGYEELGASLDGAAANRLPNGVDMAALVAPSMEQMHSVVKEDSRNRDRVAGKGLSSGRIQATINEHVVYLIEDFRSWALREIGPGGLERACADKFNAVSEKRGFPERAPAAPKETA